MDYLLTIHNWRLIFNVWFEACMSNYIPLFYKDVIFTHVLTHWGRVTHICVIKLTIIGPDNGLSPGRRQAIIWTNAAILLIGPLGTNFSGILSEIHTFPFKKMQLKMSSGKWRPFCLGLNVLIPVLVSQISVSKRSPCWRISGSGIERLPVLTLYVINFSERT